ncbi:MAG: winged helix-turn-helix transcriptional regulator [Caulobacteraceae bacterium]|nr:winged helix-turn-helix transcriptional regulator [Caulobacteraceae bacterium]
MADSEGGRPSAAAAPSDLKLDDYLPYRLSVAANAVSGLIARAYQARFDLTIPQWRLIAVLGEDGLSTQQALCARTLMDKVTVSRASAALVERGLVLRTPNASDRRSHRLALTPEGAALYRQIAPSALAYEAKLLTQFSPLEQQVAMKLLRRLQLAAIDLSGD